MDRKYRERTSRDVGRIAEGATGTRQAPNKYSLLTENRLSRSTRAGIMDNRTGQWLIRLDNPHGRVTTPHININPNLTGVPDPHTPISGSLVKGGEVATKALRVVGKTAVVTAVAVDTYRIAEAIINDSKDTKQGFPGKRTVKTTASVAGGYGGGYYGAVAGGEIGAAVGGAIGGVPGAAVGCLVGAAVGGIGGAVGGSTAAEIIVDKITESEDGNPDTENYATSDICLANP